MFVHNATRNRMGRALSCYACGAVIPKGEVSVGIGGLITRTKSISVCQSCGTYIGKLAKGEDMNNNHWTYGLTQNANAIVAPGYNGWVECPACDGRGSLALCAEAADEIERLQGVIGGLLNGDSRVISAAMKHIPSPFEIDIEDQDAFRIWLREVTIAALSERDSQN